MPLVAAIALELMTWPLAANAAGQISAENLAPEFLSVLTLENRAGIGPGLGQSPETVKFVTGLLSATTIPAVIDADALNILAAKPVLLTKLAKGAHWCSRRIRRDGAAGRRHSGRGAG